VGKLFAGDSQGAQDIRRPVRTLAMLLEEHVEIAPFLPCKPQEIAIERLPSGRTLPAQNPTLVIVVSIAGDRNDRNRVAPPERCGGSAQGVE
jgi:hypothetical protein